MLEKILSYQPFFTFEIFKNLPPRINLFLISKFVLNKIQNCSRLWNFYNKKYIKTKEKCLTMQDFGFLSQAKILLPYIQKKQHPDKLYELKFLKNVQFGKKVPKQVSIIEGLEKYSCFGYKSEKIPPANKYAKMLILDGNSLKKITKDICKFENLKEIYMTSGNINYIYPKTLSILNLTYLNLTNNHIDSLEEISKCIYLEHLILAANNFSEIGEEIGNLKNLEILDFSNNHIRNIHKNIEKLQKLEHLCLTRNYLKTLPSLENLSSLRVIIISENDIKVLPINKNVEMIRAKACKMNAISRDIVNCEKLNFLDLSDNTINYLPDELFDTNIKNINLSHNMIKELPEAFMKSKIHKIYLQGNLGLRKIPKDINMHKTLDYINIAESSVNIDNINLATNIIMKW